MLPKSLPHDPPLNSWPNREWMVYIWPAFADKQPEGSPRYRESRTQPRNDGLPMQCHALT